MRALEQIKFSKRLPTHFLGSAFAISGTFLLSLPVIALPALSVEISASPLAISQYRQLEKQTSAQSRGRVPGRRRGGARRGTCPETQTQLVAMVAATEVETETLPESYVGGITTAEHPTFWFDVPYALTDELTAEFVLQDDQGQDIYRVTSAELSASRQTPGLLGVSVSETATPLAIGQTYQWYFKVNCGSESPPYVQGGIERVALTHSLADELSTATPLEQAALYQQNEIWYDAIHTVAQLRLSEPNNSTVEAAWTNLLQSLGLYLQ